MYCELKKSFYISGVISDNKPSPNDNYTMGKIKLNEDRCCTITSSFVSIDDEVGTLVRVEYDDHERIEIEVQGGDDEKYNDEVYEFVKEQILNGEIFLPTFVSLEQHGDDINQPDYQNDFGGVDPQGIKTVTQKKIEYVETPKSV